MIRKFLVTATTLLFTFSQPLFAAGCQAPQDASARYESLAYLVTTERRAEGGRRIYRNAQLDLAAQEHACFVAKHGLNSDAPHTGARGSTPIRRMRSNGFNACFGAENLAVDITTAAAVVDRWMLSRGHKANILSKQSSNYGIGIALHGNRVVWVMVFAKEC